MSKPKGRGCLLRRELREVWTVIDMVKSDLSSTQALKSIYRVLMLLSTSLAFLSV